MFSSSPSDFTIPALFISREPFISFLPDRAMANNVERIYHTRRIWGSRVIKRREGSIESTTTESPWLDVFRQTRRTVSRIGKDSVEVARLLKKLFKIDTVQSIAGLLLVVEISKNPNSASLITHKDILERLQNFWTPATATTSHAPQERLVSPPLQVTPETNVPIQNVPIQEEQPPKPAVQLPAKEEDIVPQTEQQLPETIDAKTMIEEYELTEKDYEFLDKINNQRAIFYFDLSGNLKRLHIPQWVYQDAKTVGKKEGIPWYALVSIGLTETGNWNPRAVSSAGALGLYQIMPFNFPTYQPYEGGDPFDPLFNAWTAVRKLKHMEMGDVPFEKWVERFVSDGGWNQYLRQAQTTYALKEALKREYRQSISSSRP